MIKKVFICIVISSVMFLMACHRESGPIENVTLQNHNELFKDYVYDQVKSMDLVVDSMAIAEDGYYFIWEGVLFFYDFDSDISIPMCSRAECSHKTQGCDGFIGKMDYNTNIFVCENNEVLLYDGYLYMVERTKENISNLCRYNGNLNDKVIIAQLASLYGERPSLCTTHGSYKIVDGYFYYIMCDVDIDTMEANKYMFKYNCMRVKLEEKATPEKLGDFMFPGDYGIGVFLNSVSVLSCGKDVYFIAGGTNRFFEKDNPMQYYVTKYSNENKKFEVLASYVGNKDYNAWSIISGFIPSVNNMYMDDDATIYTIGNDGTNNNIIAFNYSNNSSKVIYKGCNSFAFDGEYFYTFLRASDTYPYLTAIDKEGNIVRQYKFDVLDSFRKKMQERGFPEAQWEKGDFRIKGIDGRYIMIHGLTETSKNYGVTLINREQFLSGVDFEIKTIYE